MSNTTDHLHSNGPFRSPAFASEQVTETSKSEDSPKIHWLAVRSLVVIVLFAIRACAASSREPQFVNTPSVPAAHMYSNDEIRSMRAAARAEFESPTARSRAMDRGSALPQ